MSKRFESSSTGSTDALDGNARADLSLAQIKMQNELMCRVRDNTSETEKNGDEEGKGWPGAPSLEARAWE